MAAVIINGPGVEIQKVIGFDSQGRSNDHSGLSQALPIVFEVGDEAAVDALNLYVTRFLSGIDSPKHVFIRVSDVGGTVRVEWSLDNYQPVGPPEAGFSGRTRYVFGPSLGPGNVQQIHRSPIVFGFADALNPAVDRDVTFGLTALGRFPHLVEVDSALSRITLVYDYVEGGNLLYYVDQVVQIGTTAAGKGRISIRDAVGPGTSMPAVDYQGCFPVKYEQFTGFGQDIKLKERVIFDCDYLGL